MKFQSRTVVCNEPGLTQEQALDGLYEAYGDVRVASIKRRGDSWVANILEKVAEFPPPKKEEGGEEEAPAPDMPEDSEGGEDEGGEAPDSDGPPSEGGDDKGGEKGKHGEELDLLHQILQGLMDAGIVQPPMDDKMIPGNEPSPEGPPAPPAGPPAGGPTPMAPGKMPSKLKPGEVLPTQTPVGAPAFSSVQHQAGAPCPTCGGQTMPDGSCPACETQGGQVPAPPAVPGTQPGPAPIHPMVGKVATFSVESAQTTMKPSEAQANLDSEFGKHGYKVKELQYDQDKGVYRALLSTR